MFPRPLYQLRLRLLRSLEVQVIPPYRRVGVRGGRPAASLVVRSEVEDFASDDEYARSQRAMRAKEHLMMLCFVMILRFTKLLFYTCIFGNFRCL